MIATLASASTETGMRMGSHRILLIVKLLRHVLNQSRKWLFFFRLDENGRHLLLNVPKGGRRTNYRVYMLHGRHSGFATSDFSWLQGFPQFIARDRVVAILHRWLLAAAPTLSTRERGFDTLVAIEHIQKIACNTK